MKRKICFLVGLCLFLFLVGGYFIKTQKVHQNLKKVQNTTTEQKSTKSDTSTKEDTKTGYKKWKFKLNDTTGTKTQEDMKKIQSEVDTVNEAYNRIALNYNKNTKNFTKQLLKLYVDKDVNDTDIERVPAIYTDYKKYDTTIQYKGFKDVCVTYAENGDATAVTLVGIASVRYKMNGLKEDDYEITFKNTFEKHHGKWLMYTNQWGKLYRKGDIQVLTKGGNDITFKGNIIATFY